MSTPDLVREEITPEHPYYESITETDILDYLPSRAVGYLWNCLEGKQLFSEETFVEIIELNQ